MAKVSICIPAYRDARGVERLLKSISGSDYRDIEVIITDDTPDDSVAEVADLNTNDIDDTPNVGTEENAQFISGVCNRKDDLLILIDLTKLFTETEWKEVTSLG